MECEVKQTPGTEKKEKPKENPGVLAELGTDIVTFGGGTIVSHLGLEYATTSWVGSKQEKIAAEPDATKQKEMTDKLTRNRWIVSICKLGGGIVWYYVGYAYVRPKSDIAKKLVYGVGTGFLLNGCTDALELWKERTAAP